MKFLFIGQLNPSGWVSTTKMRMVKLQALGYQTVPVDSEDYIHWGGRLVGGVSRRLKWGPQFRRFNLDVLRAASEHRPDAVWIEKGVWIYPNTLRKLRRDFGCLSIHYTPDPAITFHRSRHFLASIPEYDLMVTTKRYELDLYHRHGVRKLLLQYPSFDTDIHRPERPSLEERRRYEADVVFVGTYTPGRERYLKTMAQLGIDLAIWGGRWEKCRDSYLGRRVRGGSLGGRNYALALGCAKVGLGLLSPLVPDRSTTRSFEIPACGTFLLAERTEEHRALFEEGEEAEFFSSNAEFERKLRYYLKHDGARCRIADRGCQRCWDSGYDSATRVREIVLHAQEIMTSKRAA